MKEDKFTKWKQRGIEIPNPDSVNPSKPLIKDKYKIFMEMHKLKRKFYFTKELLELRAWRISEEEASCCVNITALV